MAMSLSTAEKASRRIEENADEWEVESCMWAAESFLASAFGVPDDAVLIRRFVNEVVPNFVTDIAREHQLALLERGKLRVAIDHLGELLGLPLEYAEPLLDGVVKPFADVGEM